MPGNALQAALSVHLYQNQPDKSWSVCKIGKCTKAQQQHSIEAHARIWHLPCTQVAWVNKKEEV